MTPFANSALFDTRTPLAPLTATLIEPDFGESCEPCQSDRVCASPAEWGRDQLGQFETLDVVISRHIREALRRCRGTIEGPAGAARLLDINPHTLRARMRKLKIDWQQYRPSAGES